MSAFTSYHVKSSKVMKGAVAQFDWQYSFLVHVTYSNSCFLSIIVKRTRLRDESACLASTLVHVEDLHLRHTHPDQRPGLLGQRARV